MGSIRGIQDRGFRRCRGRIVKGRDQRELRGQLNLASIWCGHKPIMTSLPDRPNPALPDRDLAGRLRTPAAAADPQTRPTDIGHVIACDGTKAVIAALSDPRDDLEPAWAVGQMITITVDTRRLIGLLFKVEADQGVWTHEGTNRLILSVELNGEIGCDDNGLYAFSSGMSVYPRIGAPAHRMREEDLLTIYRARHEATMPIGVHSQARDIPALVSTDALLSRHFAVVGTTGTGKSTAISMILHKIAEQKPDQRILILDPHNEYREAFGDKAHTITVDTLDLPFWLLSLEEFARIVFRGEPPGGEDLDILREMIPRAKAIYRDGASGRMLRKPGGTGPALTSDTPVPYRIADLIQLLDEDIGSLDGARRRLATRQLKARFDAVVTDPRFDFLFGSRDASDRMSAFLGTVFRVPIEQQQITVFEMSGIPSEVVDSIVSVLCRLAFDLALASHSRVRTLVVCEEAHRYIPTEPDNAFAPTRAAISRIAKEGRKYGVSLGIVTQRPHELDPTILSQCNTIFALRLGNDADQDVIRRAIANGSRSAVAFLSSLADRECIAFGKAVSTPMRMRFHHVGRAARPTSQQARTSSGAAGSSVSMHQIVAQLRRERAPDPDTGSGANPGSSFQIDARRLGPG